MEVYGCQLCEYVIVFLAHTAAANSAESLYYFDLQHGLFPITLLKVVFFLTLRKVIN